MLERSWTLAVVAVLWCSPVLAQGTASITGTIIDAATGKPVGDVVVTATSPAVQGERAVVTDGQGTFRLPQLPAGTYRLQVEREGYRPTSREGVFIQGEQLVRVNLSLQPAALESEEILVLGEPPTVDIGRSATGVTLSKEFIDRLALVTPNVTGTRNFESLAEAAPQVVGDRYGFGFNGGQSPENLYLLEGVSVGDPSYGVVSSAGSGVSGLGGAQIPLEFLDEAQVITGAYMPEYGRAGGGVISTTLKSGSNEFHGSAWINWWPGALTATARDVTREESVLSSRAQRVNTGDVGLELGGPILKDRLWFYVGWNGSLDLQQVTRTVSPYLLTDDRSDFLYDGAGRIRQEAILRDSAFRDTRSFTAVAKLTFLIDANQSVSASFVLSPQERLSPNFDPESSGGSAVNEVGVRLGGSNTTANLKYTGAFLDRRLLVDAAVGWNRLASSLGASDGSRLGDTTGASSRVSVVYQRGNPYSLRDFETLPDGVASRCEAPGFVPTTFVAYQGTERAVMACPVGSFSAPYYGGPIGFQTSTLSDRVHGRGSVSYLFQLLGHHIAKAGADVEWTRLSASRGYSGGTILLQFGDEFLGLRRFGYATGPGEYQLIPEWRTGGSQLAVGAYLQDAWTIADLVTINGGLRYDAQLLYNTQGALSIALPAMFSPRVGVIVDPTRQGRAKVFANYAVYHQNLPLLIADRALSGEYGVLALSGPDCQPATGTPDPRVACNDPAYFLPINGPLAPSPGFLQAPAGRAVVDPGLRPIAKGEITVGGEVELGPFGRAGLTLVHNWMFTAIEDMSNDEAATYFIGNPGQGLGAGFPAVERRYFAGTVHYTKAFRDGWAAQASYTLSSLYGNYSGLYKPETGQLDPGVNSDFDLRSLLANRTGPLPGDRTHQIKAFLAKDFELTGWLGLQVGLSYLAFSGAPLNYLSSHPIYGSGEAFIFPRGSAGRAPWNHTLNARLAALVKLPGMTRAQIGVDVLNLINLQDATAVEQRLAEIPVIPTSVPAGQTPAQAACLGQFNVPGCMTVLRTVGESGPVPVDPSALSRNHGQPVAYQLPLSVRLSARVSF